MFPFLLRQNEGSHTVQVRQYQVVLNGCREHQRFLITVLGDVTDTTVQCILHTTHRNFSAIRSECLYLTLCQLIQTEQYSAQLMHSASRQSGHTQDLSLVQCHADILQISVGNMFCLQGYLFSMRAVVIAAVIITLDLAAYHRMFDTVLIKLRSLYGVYQFAIPKHRQHIAVLNQFFQVMGYEQHRFSLVPQFMNDAVDGFSSALGQCCGCLIHDKQDRVVIQCFCNLNQLSGL